jgi:tetratricopeptide (TPR) repeat protein
MIKQTPFAYIPDDYDPDLDALERLSNSVVDLIRQRRFDEAVKACVELKRRYPDQMDWISRTAEVHEAKGELGEAIEHYRRCIAFIDANPDGFDADSKDDYRAEIDRLESRKRTDGLA